MAAVALTNSTNVRPTNSPAHPDLALRAARAGFRVLGPYAPSLASSYAERLFLTARRHPRSAWEEEALEGAERFGIPHEGRVLPAWRWGNGPSTVLLVHGWEGRGSQLAAFVEPLVEHGLSVVTFDVLGHGDAPPGISSLVEHGRAVAAAAAYLGRLHAVIAHSVGGAATLLATRFGLRADRAALIAPPAGPARFAAGFGQMLGLPPEVHGAMITRLERRYGLRMDQLDVRADAERFRAPLLVVHDASDRVVPIEDGASIARASRDGRLVTTEGLGHHRVLRAPEVLAEIIPFVVAGARAPTFAETIDGELFFREDR